MGVAKKVQFRGGTTTSHQSFTGAEREVTVDTTKKTLVVHDGITPGGVPLAKELETQNSLDLKVDKNEPITPNTNTKITYDSKGLILSGSNLEANDIPDLDASKITSGIIDSARLPSFVDDVIEYPNLASFPVAGESGKIYIALDTNKTYRWSGSAFVYITSGAVDSVAGKTGVVTLNKSDVGLNNVDNTADVSKNVLSATKLTTARTINGVSFNGTANINIEDRISTAIASATTVTIGTIGLGEYIHITGTTTITSLGTAGASGIRRTLIFDGALTLTHNATSLICPGATNIVTVAGTVIEVISETTSNWRVVSITHPLLSMAELGYLNGVTSNIQTQINSKQDTLVSGTNIKTVNGNSLIGSGDVSISVDVNGLTTKTTPNDEDNLLIEEVEDTLKKLSWANLKATLKTYFNTLYLNLFALNIGVINANTLSSGRKYISSTSTNIPIASAGFIDCIAIDGSNIMQVFTTVSSGESVTGIQYIRTGNYVTNTWTGWTKQYSQRNILGTVSQSSGVPTGAIIEQGSNASGEWTKFADGTVIGSTVFSADTNITTVSGSVFIATVNLTMPVAMTTVNDVQLVAQRVSGGVVWGGLQFSGFSTAQVNTYIIASTTGTVGKIKANFRGRWY